MAMMPTLLAALEWLLSANLAFDDGVMGLEVALSVGLAITFVGLLVTYVSVRKRTGASRKHRQFRNREIAMSRFRNV